MNYQSTSQQAQTPSVWHEEQSRRHFQRAKTDPVQHAPRQRRSQAVPLTDEQYLAQSLALVSAKALRRTRSR